MMKVKLIDGVLKDSKNQDIDYKKTEELFTNSPFFFEVFDENNSIKKIFKSQVLLTPYVQTSIRDNKIAIKKVTKINNDINEIVNDEYIIITSKNRTFIHKIDQEVIQDINLWQNINKISNTLDIPRYPNIYRNYDKNKFDIIDLVELDHEIPTQTPKNFTGELRNYQQKGFKWLRDSCEANIGGILGDEMGLGKTAQCIAVMSDLKSKENLFLLVVPLTLIQNWIKEIKKFSNLSFYVHHGAKRLENYYSKSFTNSDIDIIITTYETVIKDKLFLEDIPWKIILMDEAHKVKNKNTKRYKALKTLPRDSTIAITGTPFHNSISDIWGISNHIIKNFFGSYDRFHDDYSEEQIKNKLKSIMMMRTVDQVKIDLPPKIEDDLPINMSSNESIILDELLRNGRNEKSILGLLTNLKMFSAHPSLLSSDKYQNLFDSHELLYEFNKDPLLSNKFKHLIEMLKEIQLLKQKVIVFSEFNGLIDLIVEYVSKNIMPAFSYDGRISNREKREEIIDEFTNHKQSALLCMNINTADVGLNIQAANHVIVYTRDWVPNNEKQAIARAYRSGQEKKVFVNKFFYNDNYIDESIIRLQNEKKIIQNLVVEESEGGDIKKLIKDIYGGFDGREK
tara:strand:+ start:87 stop:1955 length:1869 start_codon:yes stop_codon:yes gene_type:complete